MSKASEWKRAEKHEKRLAQQIRKAHKLGDAHAVDREMRKYLSSYHAKWVAVSQASDEGRKSKRLSRDKQKALAEKLDVWSPCPERAILSGEPKDDNPFDCRYILSFGIENKSRQVLVRNAVKQVFQHADSQYILQGGVPAAIQAVKDAYEAGYRYTFEIDVHRCFASFSTEGLCESLPVPKEVARYVCSPRYLTIKLSGSMYNLLGCETYEEGEEEELTPGEVRKGLTVGSKASPLLAEYLLRFVIDQLPKDLGVVVNYADNFLCMSKDANDALALDKALRTALESHPAGPLKPNEPPGAREPGELFCFLGYAFLPEDPSKLRCVPADDAYNKWKTQEHDMRERTLALKGSPDKQLEVLKRGWRSLQSSVGNYTHWSDRGAFLDDLASRICQWGSEAGLGIEFEDEA